MAWWMAIPAAIGAGKAVYDVGKDAGWWGSKSKDETPTGPITPHYEEDRGRVLGYIDQVGSRYAQPTGYQAAQVGPAQWDLGQEQAARRSQSELVDYLSSQARGTAPSLAEAQMRQAADAQQRGLASQLSGAVGPQAALAMRTAATQAGQQGMELAQQAAVARLAEQQQAARAAVEAASAMRGQDWTSASARAMSELERQRWNADYWNRAAEYGASAEERRRQALTGAEQGWMEMLMGGAASERQAKQSSEEARWRREEAEKARAEQRFGGFAKGIGESLAMYAQSQLGKEDKGSAGKPKP